MAVVLDAACLIDVSRGANPRALARTLRGGLIAGAARWRAFARLPKVVV